jgi:NAD(P)-dependent dehydrogenase (short-subunit alcohol dehydrogenase family)
MTVAFPEQRTAIVTGAASQRGIGRATAKILAAAGWNIGIVDLDEAASQAVASELTAEYGVQALGVGANVANEASAHAAIDMLAAGLPQIVALANIAGVSSPVPYLELESSEWDRVISINLTGVHYVSQRVAQILADNKVGRIVNMSSVSAQRGGGTFSKTPYSVAKAGIIGLTRSLARELGPFDVTVNAIAPGPVDTDIMGGALTEDRKAELTEEQLIKRVASVQDIANTIKFLFSEEAGLITGQTINVNGGLYMS